jgi:HEAT repeat protein
MRPLPILWPLAIIVALSCCLMGCGKKDTEPKTKEQIILTSASPPEVKPVPTPPGNGPSAIPEASPSDRRETRPAAAIIWPPVTQWGLPETAADALSRIGEPAVPALVGALTDPEVNVRIQAARALARLGPPAKDAVPALTKALDDPDIGVRQNAARALGQIGPDAKEAVPELIRSLK